LVEPIKGPEQTLQVTVEPIHSMDNDQIKGSRPSIREQLSQRRAIAVFSGQHSVSVFAHNRPGALLAKVTDDRALRIQGMALARLLVGRHTQVACGLHLSSLSSWRNPSGISPNVPK
jgi:hypothetical protein